MVNSREKLSIWGLSGLYLLISYCPLVEAGYRQQAQAEENGQRVRVNASGSRGCPFAQGELYLEANSAENLSVNVQSPQIVLHITASPDTNINQQILKVSLLDLQTKQAVFLEEYTITSEKTLSIHPNLTINRPLILTAGLICNPQRPSSTKSLRILVTPHAT